MSLKTLQRRWQAAARVENNPQTLQVAHDIFTYRHASFFGRLYSSHRQRRTLAVFSAGESSWLPVGTRRVSSTRRTLWSRRRRAAAALRVHSPTPNRNQIVRVTTSMSEWNSWRALPDCSPSTPYCVHARPEVAFPASLSARSPAWNIPHSLVQGSDLIPVVVPHPAKTDSGWLSNCPFMLTQKLATSKIELTGSICFV